MIARGGRRCGGVEGLAPSGRRGFSEELRTVLGEAVGLFWIRRMCYPKRAMRKRCVKKLRDGGQSQWLELQKLRVTKKPVKRIHVWGWAQKRRNLRSNQVKYKLEHTSIMSFQGLLLSLREKQVLTTPTSSPFHSAPDPTRTQPTSSLLKVLHSLCFYREVLPMDPPDCPPHLL